ncbi:MAG: hypothetical protein ACRDNS_11220, partial [Trebonia sp.]
PYLDLPVAPGRWVAALSELTAAEGAAQEPPAAGLSLRDGALAAALAWPDGAATVTRLPEFTPSPTSR